MAEKTDNVKILVHCSAGVGRTGTFVSLYQMMEIIDTKFAEYKRLAGDTPIKANEIEDVAVDIFNTAFNLRKQRSDMVGIFTAVYSRIIFLCFIAKIL